MVHVSNQYVPYTSSRPKIYERYAVAIGIVHAAEPTYTVGRTSPSNGRRDSTQQPQHCCRLPDKIPPIRQVKVDISSVVDIGTFHSSGGVLSYLRWGFVW